MFQFLHKSEERLGEIYAFASAVLFAGFPILINYAAGQMPPVLYASLSMLVAGVVLFGIMLAQGRVKELGVRKVWADFVAVTLLVIVIPSALIFKGTQYTSGINTSILLTTEIIFTLVIMRFFGEKLTGVKIGGAVAMVIGTLAILYNGAFRFNQGDWMIIAGTVFFPIGNFYAKRALGKVGVPTLLFVRSFFGGLLLLPISFWIDDLAQYGKPVFAWGTEHWQIILINGVLLWCVSKLVWYAGLKRLEVSKAIIIAMSYPAFSMILAAMFLKEIPTPYQFGGLVITLAGLYAIADKKSEIEPYAS